MYDIIGDVHGFAGLLKKLLKQIGYKESGSSFTHPERKAIFVGDFINRGKESRKTLYIIRSMVENGNAYAILGNHEIYAVVNYLKNENGIPIAKTDIDLNMSIKSTAMEFQKFQEEWKSFRKWLRTLPLFLDFEKIRVVHACWNSENIGFLKEIFQDGPIRKQVFREAYLNYKSPLGKAIWQTTKGIDFQFPSDLRIRDNKGIFHRAFRMKWWDSPIGKTFGDMSFESKFTLPAYTVPKEIIPDFEFYPDDAPIVFFGHYSRSAGPFIIRPNVCCVDSGVFSTKTLTAYCYNGEDKLVQHNLIQVK